MKKVILILLIACNLSPAVAQELILNHPINKDDRLTFSYSVESEKQVELAQTIGRQMSAIIHSKKLDLEYAPTLEPEFVDARFRVEAPDRMYCNGREIRFKSANDAAKKGVALLQNIYYSGQRPVYSTLFKNEEEGYAEYRIPSAVVTPTGRIVAFIEGRYGHKDQSDNDIVAKYSDDNGKSWSAPIVIRREEGASLNNPCAVYIEESGSILLIYQRYPPKSTEGSALAGTEGEYIQRTFCTESTDGGESWSAPRDITNQVKHPDANTSCSGPGVAICVTGGINNGRIIVPFNANNARTWYNYVVYSDDRGRSWKIASGTSGYGTNESQIVQTGDGRFLINARSHRFPESNDVMPPAGWNPWSFARVTRNRAQTPLALSGETAVWGQTEVQAAQPDPTCQGSIIRLGAWGNGKKSRLLLANPASQHTFIEKRPYANTPPMRINGTVKISYDEGKSWSEQKRIYGNRFTEYQYSVLVDLGKGKIGCIFEVYPEVKFAVFNCAWLTSGTDNGRK